MTAAVRAEPPTGRTQRRQEDRITSRSSTAIQRVGTVERAESRWDRTRRRQNGKGTLWFLTGGRGRVKNAVAALKAAGLEPELVSGGGTGSYYFESASGVYNELQCGSYAFMDADYGRILDQEGKRIDQGELG